MTLKPLLDEAGFFDPFDDGEWSNERAAQRLSDRGISDELTAVSRSFAGVYRSVTAAWSDREKVIEAVHLIGEAIALASEEIAAYRPNRAAERARDDILTYMLEWQPPQREKHDAAVLEELESFVADAEALRKRGERLNDLLGRERPVCVRAGLYSARGAGPLDEFAWGLAMQRRSNSEIARVRGDVRPSRYRRRGTRGDCKEAEERVRSDINRVNAAIAKKSKQK